MNNFIFLWHANSIIWTAGMSTIQFPRANQIFHKDATICVTSSSVFTSLMSLHQYLTYPVMLSQVFFHSVKFSTVSTVFQSYSSGWLPLPLVSQPASIQFCSKPWPLLCLKHRRFSVTGNCNSPVLSQTKDKFKVLTALLVRKYSILAVLC